MKKTTVISYVDQALGMIDEELGSIEMSSGEMPDIDLPHLVAKAMGFLRKKRVPVTGYDVAELSIMLSGDDEAIMSIPILESVSREDNQARLTDALEDFRAKYGQAKRQWIKCRIRFLIDENQITE